MLGHGALEVVEAPQIDEVVLDPQDLRGERRVTDIVQPGRGVDWPGQVGDLVARDIVDPLGLGQPGGEEQAGLGVRGVDVQGCAQMALGGLVAAASRQLELGGALKRTVARGGGRAGGDASEPADVAPGSRHARCATY